MTSLCIHGHFYQPPREDPNSDYIPDEIGAEPFRNWNEKILAECYWPNAEAGNFEKISFNIGPTLFRWIEKYSPDTHKLIVEQENKNFINYGVSNGMGQAYNHVILPLANYQDKITQILWGIEDFKYRFGHAPTGMWCPETAINTETLCVLSDLGIKFTILAPWQINHEENESNTFVKLKLPDNRDDFHVFIYDQDLSTAVSFNPRFTVNGDEFLYNFQSDSRKQNANGIKLIASDGELYGHHQPFRNLFLSYILNEGAIKHKIDWTFPALWMKENEAGRIVELNEYSSWSCHHGVKRWETICPCTPNAIWKDPLRKALNKLASEIDRVYLDFVGDYSRNPWQLRNDFINVLLEKQSLDELIRKSLAKRCDKNIQKKIGYLLKAQYERLRMFTSCGWFFDEFHRIEPQNNIAYATKSVWLTQQATGKKIEDLALRLLHDVKSTRTGLRADTVFSQTWIRANDLFNNGLS